ncbi:hypothetical protein E3N88_16318 [Mikania micrantha]|uniref:Protein FAR1-RELATED SEQUENCE n=1 Tax=Mikania micrantha TaxID=192012 RepID=A0A5N6NZC6_9ASTR|nr:hypothetical protein E3N88_16318 [Mikania micrantha]
MNSGNGNTLVQFLLCFDTSLDHQCYKERVVEHKSKTTTVSFRTPLEIKKHTAEIFLEMQKKCKKNYQGYKNVEKIPNEFVIRKWTKNLLPKNLFSIDKLLEGIRNKGSRSKKRRVVGRHETGTIKSKKAFRKCRTSQELVCHDTGNCSMNDEACHSDQA